MAKSKAKKTTSFSLTGELSIGAIPAGLLTITETLDDQILTYDIVELMQDNGFDGETITLTFKGDQGVEPSEEE
jgi:hypothetical protein